MRKIKLSVVAGEDYLELEVEGEKATISEVLAMRAEYLLNVGVEGNAEESLEPPSTPATTFLSRTKGEVT